MSRLNKKVIRNFWRSQSTKTSNRWTSNAVLDFEIDYLRNLQQLVTDPISILDLGSGSGELAKSIQGDQDSLTAVDYEENYRRFFSDARNQHFLAMEVTKFVSDLKFDLILCYGVVTYLSESEELKIYELIRQHLAPGGTAVIKHQVSLSEEIYINTYSEDLKSDYSARYPSRTNTEQVLKTYFQRVNTLIYPEKFNKFANSLHVAYFVCNDC
jgi:2-polyprenyl-3-methyl-5-hydroxy-6-metoxy-1,4-benzoquinol methylase